MSPQQAYNELVGQMKEISLLGSTASLLAWDQRTYMPRQGAEFRSQQLALIAGMYHERFTSPKIGDLLSQVESTDLVKGDSVEAANVRELRHKYNKETKLPKELVEEIVRVTTLAETEWETARARSDFAMFAPWLEKVYDLTRQSAEAMGYEGEPYNALLDNYEPGAKVSDIEAIFTPLRKDLVELLGRIKNAPRRPDPGIVERNYPVELQKIFGEAVAGAMGYDFSAGRLDITTHPFCTGIGNGDTRITTRYNPKRLNDALFGIMHEAGHALYEMGLDKKNQFGLPAGDATSLGIHESQSRMWENQVGRSKAFWVYFLPQAKRIFRDALADVNLDAFYGAVNDVRPSYIRVEADEGTYNLHIMLRFELERALLNKELAAKDAAGEWRKRFKSYFGIEVDKDSNGILQDVHWSAGLVGYFPTYTLGNLFSAQFFAKAKADMPDLTKQFERGDFSGLLNWLRQNIHQHGGRYRANDLAQRVTGQTLSHKPLMDYLNAKYGEIYGI
ncbi:MAG: carboxypeptidase M32 [candidate division Zixibacteria bacterium]|nr:carboxypeptidase M32 [candidate division Zixibacteria bacterium]